MMAEYCRSLKRDCHQCEKPERKNNKKQLMSIAKKSKIKCFALILSNYRLNNVQYLDVIYVKW